jgi:hypothetical protein
MLQPAGRPGLPVDQFRVATAPDSSKLANPYVNRFAPRQTPNPSVANCEHGFPRSGGGEALISYAGDENIQALAPRRERLNS